MSKRIRLTDEKLPEYVANAIIELREKIDEDDGFTPDPDFCPDLDYVLMCVANTRKGENYRRQRQKSLGGISKILKAMPEDQRVEFLKKFGVN